MMDMKKFVIAGIAIAVIIGIVAIFLASGDPDGLESSALVLQGDKTLTGETPPDAELVEDLHGGLSYESPMPDYELPDTGIPGQVIAMLAGIAISFIIVLGVARVASGKKEAKNG